MPLGVNCSGNFSKSDRIDMTYSLYLNKTNKLLNRFTINIDNRNYKTSYFIALEKSKTLTNLLGIIYGEYITS
ncbi:MAG: hypothetical protein J4F36_13020, partial [Nitrosopumilaceae archaeon]|nr:hypothetical protein [Nitrosopumilaceae archaeon]